MRRGAIMDSVFEDEDVGNDNFCDESEPMEVPISFLSPKLVALGCPHCRIQSPPLELPVKHGSWASRMCPLSSAWNHFSILLPTTKGYMAPESLPSRSCC